MTTKTKTEAAWVAAATPATSWEDAISKLTESASKLQLQRRRRRPRSRQQVSSNDDGHGADLVEDDDSGHSYDEDDDDDHYAYSYSLLIIEMIQEHSQAWKDQLQDFVKEMTTPKNRSEIGGTPKMKALVVSTRNALRFASTCLRLPSLSASPETTTMTTTTTIDCEQQHSSHRWDSRGIHKIQNEIVIQQQWIQPLTQLLTLNDRRDFKCHSMACKLFNNLLTGNPATSSYVAIAAAKKVNTDNATDTLVIRLSPSAEQISRSILLQQCSDDDDKDDGSRDEDIDDVIEPNWVDMILSASSCSSLSFSPSSNSRDPLAAIIATLHNCLAALPLTKRLQSSSYVSSTTQIQFATSIAADGLLISTLLRLFVPANKAISGEDNGDSWDDATEWIELLLVRLTGLGLLPTLFQSIYDDRRNNHEANPNLKLTDDVAVVPKFLPEQIVLLKVVGHEVYEYMRTRASKSSSTSSSSSKTPHLINQRGNRDQNGYQGLPLGGLVAGDDDEGSIKRSYKFLSDIVSNLSPVFPLLFTVSLDDASNNSKDKEGALSHNIFFDGDDSMYDETETILLRQYSIRIILHILATTTGIDDESTTRIRSYLGQSTTILQDAAKNLGFIVDNLAARYVGKKARDVVLTPNEQSLMTTLVQLIGNLVHRCPSNQNILRCTLVPPHPGGVGVSAAAATATAGTEGSKARTAIRSGLHVLLSCTSYSTSCFSLREWAVLAIRNVLENNTENQRVVAELIAQDPVKSADLEHLGINVKLDTTTGKVSMAPMNAKTSRTKIKVVKEDEDDNGRENEDADGECGSQENKRRDQ